MRRGCCRAFVEAGAGRGGGLVALAAVFVLYVGGHHDLPLWLNGSAGVLVPLGLALALFGLVREAGKRR